MFKSSFFIFFLGVFVTHSCDKKQNDEFGLNVIDIEKAFLNRERVNLSSLGSLKVDYIRLETSDMSLLGAYPKLYLDSSYIYAVAFRQVKVFDRATGKFLKELGSYGQGPDQYTATLTNTVKSKYGGVFVRRNDDIFTLDSNDGFIKRFTLAEGITSFIPINDSTFAGFRPNWDCLQDKKIVIFDINGIEVNSFPYHEKCDTNPKGFEFDHSEGRFYKNKNQILFKEIFNDTLFAIDQLNYTPLLVFHQGRFSQPYSKKNFMSDEDKMNHGIIGNISYFKSKMTFSLFLKNKLFYGVYDKNLNATKISQSNSEQDINGFNNDIDGFVDFYPSYSTNSNEIVGKVNAEIVYEWFQKNPDKISSLPKKLQAYKNIKPEDNPIMMIVKLN